MEELNNKFLFIAKHLFINAGSVEEGENVLILYDKTTKDLLYFFKKASEDLNINLSFLEVSLLKNHGTEINSYLSSKMKRNDLVMALLKKSIAHTKARMHFNSIGGRFLSLPDYNFGMFSHPSILFDFKSQLQITKKITNILSKSDHLEVRSSLGTSLKMNIKGRKANCCPGFVDKNHLLGSPPDIETNISPIEEESNGKIIVDGSITVESIGLLKTPVELEIIDGKIKSFKSKDQIIKKNIEEIFSNIKNPKAYDLAECGIGLNPMSKLTGNMLTDEGAFGCIHFGFGSNITVGGKNDVPFHLDFVIKKPDLFIDGFKIIERGNLSEL